MKYPTNLDYNSEVFKSEIGQTKFCHMQMLPWYKNNKQQEYFYTDHQHSLKII